MKITLNSFLTICIATCLLSACSNSLTEEEKVEKAKLIHSSILTIDTHNDTPFRFTNPDYNMAEKHDARKGGGKMDFPRMKEGGLDGAFFAVFVGQGPRDEVGHQNAYERAMKVFSSIETAATQYSDLVEIATTQADAVRLEKEGKVAMFIGVENGYPIGNDLSKVEEFYNLGARYITLCHSRTNDICDSSTDRGEPEHGGLSEFGFKVVDEMNRLGMMVDISHASDESFFDAVEFSKAPIIASHSSARALCDSPRNLTDEMLLALKENGGVIQICILSSYIKADIPNPERDKAFNSLREEFEKLNEDDSVRRDELRKEWNLLDEQFPRKLATVQDAVDHIDHVVNLIGIDHVGIGTDFDGGGGIDGCYDVSEMANITIELFKRGYTEKQIEKIWSGNILRVMNEVQEVAKEITKT